MTLTYTNGQFIFTGKNLDTMSSALLLAYGSEWKWHPSQPHQYTTRTPLAAVQFRQYADKKAESILRQLFVTKYPAPLTPLPSYLDAHQKEGLNWILTRSRSYLAHAPGAGKTAQVILSSLYAKGPYQSVFIVPPDLVENWRREILIWTDREGVEWPSIAVISTSAKQKSVAWLAQFLIVPDSMLTKEWVYRGLVNIDLKVLAVDEASRFKESLAARTVALFGGSSNGVTYRGLAQNAKHVVLMDGSPMPNGRHMELWAPLYAIAPDAIDFASQQDYGFKYCGAKINDRGVWEFKHSSNADELHKRITKDFMHVVTEDKLEHPERRRKMIFLSKDPRNNEMRKWEEDNLSAINFSDLSEKTMERGDIASYRQQLGISKVPMIANYVARLLEDKNEKIILFAWHREVVHGLQDLLKKYKPGVVLGGTSATEREEIFDQFQAGRLPLIIGNIAAMGRGHNLQKAGRAVFGEWSWSDELNKQAEKRASRRGNEKDFVNCDYLVAPGTMDEITIRGVFRKERNTKKVIK